jgi:hypothetical protein
MNKKNVPVIIQEQKQFLAQWLRERDMERIMASIEHPKKMPSVPEVRCPGGIMKPRITAQSRIGPHPAGANPFVGAGCGRCGKPLLYAAGPSNGMRTRKNG